MYYSPVPNDDLDTKSLKLDQRPKRDAWHRFAIVIPWVSTLCLGYLTMFLAVSRHKSCHPKDNTNLGSFSTGYATDFGKAACSTTSQPIHASKSIVLDSRAHKSHSVCKRTHKSRTSSLHGITVILREWEHLHTKPRSCALRWRPKYPS